MSYKRHMFSGSPQFVSQQSTRLVQPLFALKFTVSIYPSTWSSPPPLSPPLWRPQHWQHLHLLPSRNGLPQCAAHGVPLQLPVTPSTTTTGVRDKPRLALSVQHSIPSAALSRSHGQQAGHGPEVLDKWSPTRMLLLKLWTRRFRPSKLFLRHGHGGTSGVRSDSDTS